MAGVNARKILQFGGKKFFIAAAAGCVLPKARKVGMIGTLYIIRKDRAPP
jgi:hypothetical protein